MLNKLKETVIPVVILFAIVGLLFLVRLIPFDSSIFLNFSICCLFLILGQIIFLFGADNSIIKMGKHSGVGLMKSKKLWLIILFGAIFGLLTTLAEPDLQLLSKFLSAISQNIPQILFLIVVGVGVSVFVAVAYYRILKGVPLKYFLIATYCIVFILAIFSSGEYLSLAFDASGITTGPITVPFLLALTIGICSARSSGKKEDNFGVVALASTGPIVAVLILSFFYTADPINFVLSRESFASILLENIMSVAIAFVPIILIFVLLQIFMFKFPKKQLIKMLLNFLVCSIGLVIFLTSAVYGFSPMGKYLGFFIQNKFILLVFAVFLGLILVFTEPAIKILLEQIEDITSGSIKPKSIKWTLGIAIALSLVLSLLRIFFDFSIWYYLLPSSIIALTLTFFTPPLFYSIGFDSGGVVSGTMLVAFVLPFFIGISNSLHSNSFSAFGTVALTSILPIIAIELLGLIYKYKIKKNQKELEQESIKQQEEQDANTENKSQEQEIKTTTQAIEKTNQ